MKNGRFSFSLAMLFVAGAFGAVSTAQDTITFQGGELNVADNWLASDGVTTGFPIVGDTGIIDVDSNFPTVSGAGNFTPTGDLIFGGGTTLTAQLDVVASNPASMTFNDVTVNVDDDIFTGAATGNFIFNVGSVTNVDDDFEANAGGTITVNGGTHTTGLDPTGTSNFGAQRDSTMNFFGGNVTTGLFRAQDNGTLFGTINIDGDATVTADSIELSPLSVVSFASTWTGSITISDGGIEAALLGTTATFDGVPIDAAVFADNFVLSADGTSLSAVPSTGGLLGDANCDDEVDFRDIVPFIALISGGGFKAQADIDPN